MQGTGASPGPAKEPRMLGAAEPRVGAGQWAEVPAGSSRRHQGRAGSRINPRRRF